MNIAAAYCFFCDDNNLQRIDASPGKHIENIDKMSSELERYKLSYGRLEAKEKAPLEFNAQVCWVDKGGEQGSGRFYFVRMPSGHLIDCGMSRKDAELIRDKLNV